LLIICPYFTIQAEFYNRGAYKNSAGLIHFLLN